MPKRIPSYRHQKARNLAVVRIDGKDHYLGRYNSSESKTKYHQLIAEWLARGRALQPGDDEPPADFTVTELIAAYWDHAKEYYRKDGKPTGSVPGIKAALRYLRRNYGDLQVRQFGPLKLRALRDVMISDSLSRRYINDLVNRIRRCFRWGVSRELVEPTVVQSLNSLEGLAKGRSKARESDRVLPVSEEWIDATLPFLPKVVADMVRFQRLTGARPGEVCRLRPCDVDRGGDVWVYQPESHKTEHHDHERLIFIGPRAQAILRPYLLRDAARFCFSPRDSEDQRLAERHANRQTPLAHGNHPGSNRKRRPKRTARDRYDKDSYRKAIHRACDLAFPAPDPLGRRAGESDRARCARLTVEQLQELDQWQKNHRWSPNQLRHAAATEIRQKFGLEAAQVALGHSRADVTQVYAERDQRKALEVMREVG